MRQPTDAWDQFSRQKSFSNFIGWLSSLLTRAAIVAGLFILIQVPPTAMEILREQSSLNLTAIITIACFILVFIGIIWLANRTFQRYNRTPKVKMRLRKSIGYVIWGYIAIYAGQIILGMLNLMVYDQKQTANNSAVSQMMANNNMVMIVFGLSTVIFTPIAEELIFRGVVTNLFFKPRQMWPKLILSGIIFSLGHMSTNIISFLIYFYMGMVLAFVYQKTGNIKVSMSLHALNNVIAIGQMIMLLTH